MKCDVCLNHANWHNDRDEHGCICIKGYDLAHHINCEQGGDVHCGEFFDKRIQTNRKNEV